MDSEGIHRSPLEVFIKTHGNINYIYMNIYEIFML